MKNISDQTCRETETRFQYLFLENHNVYEIMHRTAGQATDDNMAHAQCMLDTLAYKCAQGLCNAHCFSTAIMVARRIRNVTLYVHFLSCLILSTVQELAIVDGEVKC